MDDEPMDDVQARRLERIDRVATVLDSAVRLPVVGVRVGVDSLLGLIPGIGDLSAAAISTWLMREAWAGGARKRAIARMIGNVAIDTVVGSVPLVGDLFDIGFKANRRNALIAREELSRRPRPRR